MDTHWIIDLATIVTVVFVVSISRNIEKILAKASSSGDLEHDEVVDKQINKSLEYWTERADKLESGKETLPYGKMKWERDTWDDKKYRTVMFEALYGMIGSGDYYLDKHIRDEVTIDDYLAYPIATYAYIKNELETLQSNWHIKKIKLLGYMRKREIVFGIVASDEFELRSLEREIDQLHERLARQEEEIRKELRRASGWTELGDTGTSQEPS
jgi:hypothetical protein